MCCQCFATALRFRISAFTSARTCALAGVAICAAVFVACGGQAHAQEYSISTRVYRLGQALPVATSLTLFQDGVGYDFPANGNGVVTVIDPQNSRLVLVDPRAKKQAMVTMPTLSDFIQQLRDAGMKHPSPDRRIMFNPQLAVKNTGNANIVLLASKAVTYRVKGIKPPQTRIADEYLRFLNWSARLNATHPGNMPPFARIRVNVELLKHGLIPAEGERTIIRGQHSEKLRSTHTAVWSLSAAEKQNIHEVRAHMARLPTNTLNILTPRR